jgi:hypothetical protein
MTQKMEDILYKKAFFLVLLSSLFILGPIPAKAGFITLQTQTTPSFDGKKFKLKVNVTNRGDEPTYNVVVSADVNGAVTLSPAKEVLEINETYSLELVSDLTFEKPGRYPVVVNVDYADANQYPFSSPSISHVVYQDSLPLQIFGTLENVELSTGGTVKLTLKNMDEKEKKAMVRLVIPKELSSSDLSATVPLKGRSEKEMRFKIKNFSALPGSTYSIFAIIGYDEGNQHYSTSVGGSVKVIPDPGFVKTYQPFLIGLGVVLGTGFVYLNLRSFRKRKKLNLSSSERNKAI